MKEWLRETHAPGFELLRHFLRRFFDSDLITTPDHTIGVLIAAIPVFFQWFFLLMGPLRRKYAYLSHLQVPGPYRAAVRADELWLITLMMSAIGLLTAIKWQSLFPNLRDYRALGSLPLRPRQIFEAKLAALLLVSTATLITLNFLPSICFPAVSGGRWAIHSSLAARGFAYAGASLAACYFIFFALLAIQGVLLNLLPPRAFGRVTGNLQGFLVAIMLVLIVASFSIQPPITKAVMEPAFSRWLPPVWFLGLCQTLSGEPDPVMRALANRAEAALGMAAALAFLSYILSYHRHRTLLIEGIAGPARERRSRAPILDWLARDPCQQAVLGFMTKTLTRSSYHRMILTGYAGLGFAIVLTGLIGMRSLIEPSRFVIAGFVYFHIIVLLLLLIGTRHLFSIPAELKANWIFQITEGEGRLMWLRAVDQFVLFWGAALMLVIPLPLEYWLIGWRGAAETGLFVVLGLLVYEWSFSSWEKLPFTCSYLPGKTPIWIILAFFGLIGGIALVHALLMAILFRAVVLAMVLAALFAVLTHFHRMRRKGWPELRLKYEEVPEPAVRELRLLK